MKKFASIFLTLAMIFTLSVPAFAAGTETYTLTINGAAGHTYDIFQIFTGTIHEDNKGTPADPTDDATVLSNIKFGQNYIPMGHSLGQDVTPDYINLLLNAANPATYASGIINDENNPFKNDVTPDTEGIIEVELPAGYYLIEDVTTGLVDGQTQSSIILQMVGDVTVTSKHATVSSQKKVKDINDSTGESSGWQDSADYDIGDAVPFQLTFDLPSIFDSYGAYEITFHDKQAAGFATPVISKVYILHENTEEIPLSPIVSAGDNGYKLNPSCGLDTCEYRTEGHCTFTVEVGDIEAIYVAAGKTFIAGDKVIVEYTAELENDAVVGRAGLGNTNSMYVCHPDGHTPKDIVTVFTYGLNINKVDENGDPLSGAEFTLYKRGTGADDWTALDAPVSDGVEFTWSGLDDGIYKLVESKTPDGYNTMADKVFSVVAGHTTYDWHGVNSAFLNVVAKEGTTGQGDIVFADADADMNEDGILQGDITNYKGAELPETGAQGTILLVALGTVLVLVAGVFMITRKKMSIYED